MTDEQPVDELGYADALAELEQILDRLEHDEPDVDRVADDVARATAFIVHCRARITEARLRVDEVVADLADPAAEGHGTGEGGTDDGIADDEGSS